MNSKGLFRIRLLSLAFVIVALLLSVRLFFIQIVNGEKYSIMAFSQYSGGEGDLYSRGSIFFREKGGGLVSAATLKSGYILALHPNLMGDPLETYNELSRVIELDKDEFLMRAGKLNDPYEEIATRIDDNTREKISDLGLEGISMLNEQWRYYPGERLASHALGRSVLRTSPLRNPKAHFLLTLRPICLRCLLHPIYPLCHISYQVERLS